MLGGAGAAPASLDLRLQWDGAQCVGWVWGSVWLAETGDLFELGTVELEGDGLEADVIELLSAIYNAGTSTALRPRS